MQSKSSSLYQPLSASSYYNKFWLEAQHPAGFLSFSCLSYNEGSNWLTTSSLGFHVRKKDCQPSPYCSVRFEQVEPWSSRHPID
nr:MAG TPA: hypothetical protein [Caudoviricetes sp.]